MKCVVNPSTFNKHNNNHTIIEENNNNNNNNIFSPFLNLFHFMVDDNNNSRYGFDSPGELESIKSSETGMSDSDHEDTLLSQQHDSTIKVRKDNDDDLLLLPSFKSENNSSSSRFLHSSDSYPQSLSDRINRTITTTTTTTGGGTHSLNRSNSAPVMRSPRRIIFPSIHDHPPQLNNVNNNNSNIPQPPQDHHYHSTSNLLHRSPQGTVDSDVLNSFHVSLSLNWININSKKSLDHLPTSSSPHSAATNITETTKIIQTNTTTTTTTTTTTNLSISPKIGSTSIHTKEFEISPSSITSLPPTSPPSPDQTIPNKLPKPGPSILRRTRFDMSQNKPSTFIEPPPLFPISSSSTTNTTAGSSKEPFQLKSRITCPTSEKSNHQKLNSETFNRTRKQLSMEETSCKKIKFDPRVFVIEFKRSLHEDIWFSNEELNQFKVQAIKRIQQREMRMIHSGTGRIVGVRPSSSLSKINFSNQALSAEDEECEDDSSIQSNPTSFHSLLTSEIRSVLIIDPHDIILNLLAKGIKSMLPFVSITTAHDSSEAFEKIFDARENSPLSEGGCTHGFDLIIVEERLTHRRSMHSRQNDKTSTPPPQSPFPESGSGLIRSIRNEEVNMLQSWKKCNSWQGDHPRFAMLIGISAHLEQDQDKMTYAGANLMWGKPPPPMDHHLCKKILDLLLKKRGRDISCSKN